MHRIFERTCDKYPNEVALRVAGTGRTLTYLELDHVSNQIAHALSRFVVGPHSIVAVILHRNVLMYVKQLIFVCISVTHTITLYPLYPLHLCTPVIRVYTSIYKHPNTPLNPPIYTLYALKTTY